jgi:outer membrane protein assembly factor BamB
MWKATGLGQGFSTVSVVGDRIFTMGDDNEKQSSFIRCISLADGKPIWSSKVGKPGGDHPGTRCTPTVDGEMVYALGQWGDLVAVMAADGKEVWRKNMKNDFGGKQMSGWGYAESPLVDGDMLLVTPGGKGAMVALDKKNGELKWRSNGFDDAAAYSSIVPCEIAGVKQFVQITGQSVVGVSPEGKVLWVAKRAGKTAVVPTPIVYEDQVFVTSGYGVGCNLFKVTKSGDKFSAEQVYANTDMANHHGGLIRIGEYIYGHSDSRGWSCVEMKSGKVMWAEKSKLQKGSIAYADGHFYCRAESGKGTIVLIDASPDGWKERGRFDQPERSKDNSWPQPVIADGRLFIRDNGLLFCYDVRGKAVAGR